MLLMKEAIVTVNIKIIIYEMPSSLRNRLHSIIYSPSVPTNTFYYCCCFYLFIFFFVLLLSVSNFFCAPPFTTNHSCHSHFFFYLWMKQNIDFLMTSSSSFPQAFFYIFFFSLLCYSFFYPPLQSLFFLWINTLFQESVNIQEKMMKIHKKMLSVIGNFFYKTLNKGKGEGCGKKINVAPSSCWIYLFRYDVNFSNFLFELVTLHKHFSLEFEHVTNRLTSKNQG